MLTEVIIITPAITIALSEVEYRFVRSSGPGGQHVNKTSTQVELLFDVAHSPSLTDAQRQRILLKLKNLIDQTGVLHLSEQSGRSQYQNKRQITEKFKSMLAAALRVPKPRRPTRPTKAAKEKRLEGKKQRSLVKKKRSKYYEE